MKSVLELDLIGSWRDISDFGFRMLRYDFVHQLVHDEENISNETAFKSMAVKIFFL